MKNFDYNIHDIYHALSHIGIQSGDSLFVHSNIGFFGRCQYVDTQEELCQTFFDAIMNIIGEHGTLVVPTFTYSFPRKQVYDPDLPSPMGAFSEYVRKKNLAIRSNDPCYSIAAIGERDVEFSINIENSFSQRSFFNRFWKRNGKIMNFNFDAGSTFIHFFERELEVPYRFDKRMIGSAIVDGLEQTSETRIYVSYLHPDLEADFTTFDQLARKHNLYRTTKLGRGEIGVITADDTYKLIKETLPERPWFLTKAEITGNIPTDYTSLR